MPSNNTSDDTGSEARSFREDTRGQTLGRFSEFVAGAIALGIFVIVVLFLMQVAGGMAADMNDEDFSANETKTAVFTAGSPNDTTVDNLPSDDFIVSLNEDEEVKNNSGTVLTESTDYQFFASNGTLRLFNTSSITNNTDVNISYTGVEKRDEHQSLITSSRTAFDIFGTSSIIIPAAVVIVLLVAAFGGFNFGGGRLGGR